MIPRSKTAQLCGPKQVDMESTILNQLSSQLSATTSAKPSPTDSNSCASTRHALPTDVPQPQLQLEMCHSCGMVGASKRYALPTDVPQPQLRLEMCHSCGMVVDDMTVWYTPSPGAVYRGGEVPGIGGHGGRGCCHGRGRGQGSVGRLHSRGGLQGGQRDAVGMKQNLC